MFALSCMRGKIFCTLVVMAVVVMAVMVEDHRTT
jgi:hypothetical protein